MLVLLGAGLSWGIHSLTPSISPVSERVTTGITTLVRSSEETITPEEATTPEETATLDGELLSVADVVENTGAAVVTITTTRSRRYSRSPSEKQQGFEDFFGQFPRRRTPPERREQGSGSGFVIDSNGHIITNAHVVQGATQVTVTLRDGQEFTGEVLGSDMMTDIAVIQIDAEALPFLALGDSEELRVGEAAIAIGNPLGLDNTVTTGIISATGRSSGEIGVPDRRVEFIQTDAAINPGNSGGPLLNRQGQVIGINTAIIQNAQGLGFAIPINTAREVATQIIETGEIQHAYLGVRIATLTPALQEELGFRGFSGVDAGVVVVEVMPSSPAAEAGLKQGDVILRVGETATATASDLQQAVSDVAVGSELSLLVQRGGEELEISVVTGRLPS
ncbi:UNVERIFIED_CONTAM: hypothetical protein BEN50_11575 [Euhalothece sp. KZN 001]